MDIQEEGELFEIWWENHGQYNRAGGGDYEKTFAWESWIVAKAQAVPEGFVLAPKQPTEKMIDAGHDFCKNNIVTPSGFYKAMIEAQEQK